MSDFDTTSGILSSAVATSGTFTSAYPDGGVLGAYRSGKEHKLIVAGKLYSAPEDFGVAYTSSTVITITWRATNTLPANASWRLQMDKGGAEAPAGVNRAVILTPLRINLGAPITADVDGVSVVQLVGAAGNLTITGAQATGGVATLDVPRNVTLTAATTNHSARTFTVTGTDEYGAALVETIAGPNANTVAGVKAFKTVTQVAVDGAIATNGVSVGFGDLLGLPVFVDAVSMLIDREDGATITDGTLVGGLSVLTKSTATTADVRGTYDPNSACNGAKVFELDVLVSDPTFLGNPQYDG
jgi:hypothetical protein